MTTPQHRPTKPAAEAMSTMARRRAHDARATGSLGAGRRLPALCLHRAANLVTAIGFALLLVAASEFAGGIAGWRQGLLWGLAGFAVFTLAPGLGLPPELPAMPAAELGARQVWWFGTVAATAAGLALIAFRRSRRSPRSASR